ncbi:MAG: NADH:flavin oxidoreductase/NADH oxidase [Rhodospirillales bacterium]|nr:MAG: NADH:flavin oxidoreductase/NADH oxidase [Rhodospirillales bacterium]
MSSTLFSPIELRGLNLPNRIVVSPMCQYCVENGVVGDWHRVHLGMLANSGAGLLIVEATAVTAQGRISPGCVGLYNDETEAGFASVLKTVRAVGRAHLGIQLGHAGRKGSTAAPWVGRGAVAKADGGWDVVGPSPIPFMADWLVPQQLDRAGMDDIRAAFVSAAQRAARLGFEFLELHSAHGYLLSSFVSPLSNRRGDDYGGSRENRMRFPLEVAAAVREVWPSDRPMSVRINGTDWVDGGWTPEDAVVYAAALKGLGVDIVTVSSGGIDPAQQVPVKPGYQVPIAAKVRTEAKIPTITVGMITAPRQAESIVAGGDADMVALARGMLFNPRWGLHAAAALGVQVDYPPQYQRATPETWPPAKDSIAG